MPETKPVWRYTNQGKAETVKLSPRLYCNQIGATINAAVQGLDITRLRSHQIDEQISHGHLTTLLSDFEEDPLPVNIVRLENKRSNAKIRSFIDLAVERLRGKPMLNP